MSDNNTNSVYRAFLLCTAAVALGACGGGGSDSGPDTLLADLDSPSKVLKHAATTGIVSYLPIYEFTDGKASSSKANLLQGPDSPPRRISSRSSHQQKAVAACSGGGTKESTDVQVRNVDSPYSSSVFSVIDTVSDDCRLDGEDGAYEVFNGLNTVGCPLETQGAQGLPCEESDSILFIGKAAPGSPSREFAVSKTPDNERLERSYEIDSYSYHSSYSENQTEAAFTSTYRGTKKIGAGPQIDFERSIGAPDMPRTSRDFGGFEVGLYDASGDYRLVSDNCNLGEYTVRAEDVAYQRGSVTFYQATSGRVEVKNGDRTGSIEFQEDGSLLVTDSSGGAQTFRTIAQVREAIGDCLPFTYY